jgi:Mn2+/Fe2+ NRAMP family transporter
MSQFFKNLTNQPGIGRNIIRFLAIMGPGIITANVDNDAGGLATYSQAGALYGLKLLWLFIPVSIALIMVQEMVNRMGIVSGDGLSSLIRERFGVKITFYLMLVLFITNFGNVMAEFAGIASAAQLFGIPAFIAVPICGFLVWYLAIHWNYKAVERVFLIACIFYLAYPITCVIVKPNMTQVTSALITPTWEPSSAYLFMMIGLIGTTIAPWMQFYQQAAVVEKRVGIEDLSLSRLDTIIGCVVVNVVAMAIVIVCAVTLFKAGIRIDTADEAARSLEPLAGKWARHLFAFGLWNASMFAASILPLSTSYTICEALGWERGLDRNYDEAPQFYSIYTIIMLLGALAILIPGISLIKVMLVSQVINGLLLPIILIFMLILINDKRIMGQYTNGRIYNIISVAIVAALSIISVTYVIFLLLF